MPLRFAAFLSYSRFDDSHNDGAISTFRQRLSHEIQAQTGQEFPIFQDRDNLLVGQPWRNRIETTIDGSTFLIAIVTPSFLRSEACRSEVELFRERELQLGRSDLLIPILFIETLQLHDTQDDLATYLAERQYFSWTEFRFMDADSQEVRAAMAELSKQVVEALQRSGEVTDDPIVLDQDDAQEDPGSIEILAVAEATFPIFQETIVAFGSSVKHLGELVAEAGKEMNAPNNGSKPAAAQVIILAKLSKSLETPVREMELLASDYVDQLALVDAGISTIIENVRQVKEPDEVASAEALLRSLQDLSEEAEVGLRSIESMSTASSPIASRSSTIRPVLRRMMASTAALQPSIEMFKSWHVLLSGALEEANAR